MAELPLATVHGDRYDGTPSRSVAQTMCVARGSTTSRIDQVVLDPNRLEARSAKQHTPLLLVALPAAQECEHQHVQPLTAVRLVARWDDGLEHEQPCVRGSGGADRVQDRRRLLIVPVVEDPREDVDVALRNAVEKAAGDK